MAKQEIAVVAEDSSHMASVVVVICVPVLGAWLGATTDSAFAALRRKHGITFLKRDAVQSSQLLIPPPLLGGTYALVVVPLAVHPYWSTDDANCCLSICINLLHVM